MLETQCNEMARQRQCSEDNHFYPKKDFDISKHSRFSVYFNNTFFCSGISANWSVRSLGAVEKGQRTQIHWCSLIWCEATTKMAAKCGIMVISSLRHRISFVLLQSTICMGMKMKMANGRTTIKRRCLFHDYFDCDCCQPVFGSSRKLLFIKSHQMTAIVVLLFTWMEGTQQCSCIF